MNDNFCDTDDDCRNPSQPVCDVEFHTCFSPDAGVAVLSCDDQTRCPARVPVCSHGICSPCTSDEQCGANVCQSNGSCAPLGDTLFVDNNNGSCSGTHAGTATDPFCEISTAVEVALAAKKPTIEVKGSSAPYQAVSFKPRAQFALAIIGTTASSGSNFVTLQNTAAPAFEMETRATGTLQLRKLIFRSVPAATGEQKSALVFAGRSEDTIVAVTGSEISASGRNGLDAMRTTVRLDQVAIHDSRQSGVVVSDGKLEMTDCQIRDNSAAGLVVGAKATGLIAKSNVFQNSDGILVVGDSDTSVTIEQSALHHNRSAGLRLLGSPQYSVTNNVMFFNRLGAHLESGGLFQFNTVVDNLGTNGKVGGIECGTLTAVMNSIVVRNGRNASQVQTSDCVAQNLVTDSSNFLANNGVQVDFEDQAATPYKLRRNSARNRDCCVDKITSTQSFMPRVDFQNSARPQGRGLDIGAYEVE